MYSPLDLSLSLSDEGLGLRRRAAHLGDIAVEVNGAVSQRAIRGAGEEELQFQQPEIVNRLRKQLFFFCPVVASSFRQCVISPGTMEDGIAGAGL